MEDFEKQKIVIEYESLRRKYYRKEGLNPEEYERYQIYRSEIEPNMYKYRFFFNTEAFNKHFGINDFYWGPCL